MYDLLPQGSAEAYGNESGSDRRADVVTMTTIAHILAGDDGRSVRQMIANCVGDSVHFPST
jgi:hypothetical protein